MRAVLIACALVISTDARAEYTMFKLDLSPYPVGKVSVQPDYSTGKQTMFLDQVMVSLQPNGKTKLMTLAGGGSQYLDFFVTSPVTLSGNVLRASWSGKWFTAGPSLFSLGGGHFEGIAAIRAKDDHLYLETDGGSKLIGSYKRGASYQAFLTISYASGAKTPTATFRYIEHLSPEQSHIYGPVSVTFNTSYDALASTYFTFLTYGQNAVDQLYGLSMTTGDAVLRLPDFKHLPPQQLPLMKVPSIPFMHGQTPLRAPPALQPGRLRAPLTRPCPQRDVSGSPPCAAQRGQ